MFSFLGKECDDDLGNYENNSWLYVYVFNKDVKGYIYKKKILEIRNLPSLKMKRNLKNTSAKTINGTGNIVCSNDTLSVTMQVQIFDEQHHIGTEWLHGTVKTPSTKETMDAHGEFETEIREIIVMDKEIKYILSYEMIKDYCNPHTMHVHIGKDGELYIYIGGGTEEESYSLWLSVVNGEIVDTCFEDHCW
jgi:hypothetical protein